MPNVTLETVIEEVKTLSMEDRKSLRLALNKLLSEEAKREAFEQAMLEAGLFSEIRRPEIDVEEFRSYKPIKVEGKPVSETIIEERR